MNHSGRETAKLSWLKFLVWILPTSAKKGIQLPDIGHKRKRFFYPSLSKFVCAIGSHQHFIFGCLANVLRTHSSFSLKWLDGSNSLSKYFFISNVKHAYNPFIRRKSLNTTFWFESERSPQLFYARGITVEASHRRRVNVPIEVSYHSRVLFWIRV